MKERIIQWIRTNYIPFLFAACAVLIELTAVAVTGGKFYIRSPWMQLSVLFVLTAAQFFIYSNKARHIYSYVVLSVILVTDLLFIILYELTGTIFDFSMLKLRNDAMGIIESVPINFVYGCVSGCILGAFIVFGGYGIGKVDEPKKGRGAITVVSVTLAVALLCHATCAFFAIKNDDSDPYLTSMLYGKNEGSYADRGVTGNLFTEVYRGLFSRVETGDADEISDFIYAEVVGDEIDKFGAASNYNVVTVLGETFEWFSFVKDGLRFPNGHKADESLLRELYPNLYALYDSSVVMTNYHSREKTDISENMTMIGNYPLEYYLNYDYESNNIAYSMPNLMRSLYGVESISFHNGTNTFYNRNKYLVDAVGFQKFVSSEQMAGDKMTNWIEKGDKNLDSEMIAACADEMFPTDRRFNTYITTITMHGKFMHRKNLEKYYAVLDEKGILPLQEETTQAAENANAFRYYAAATMEFDAAIGMIVSELEERGLTDNTLLLVFGDHNAYYQSLSNYVKNIYPNADKSAKIPDLYRVPFMVKIGRGESETKIIDKFTCTADVYPTILSLLGVRYYGNLTYGHSVFDEKESILYSRAYDVFMTDKTYFTSFNNIKWQVDGLDESYYADIERRALELLKKTSYVNRIYAADYFTGDRLTEFNTKMKAINGGK